MNTKLFSLLGICFLGAALSGCGPNLLSDGRSSGEDGLNSYSYSQTADADYSCGFGANILPTSTGITDGTQRYTTCTNNSSSSKIKVYGISSTSRMICAYPVQYINSSQFLYKADGYGQPVYACYDAWSDQANGYALDFAVGSYNGLLVVEQGSRPSMTTCLMTGQSCPTYSIGKFR
ncbi:MAG: hypothetical protein JST04_04355 [Bdellovibrionales bacterium]|nr:hypothetical protein [Bdellovibrionales bacterium]